MQQWAGGGLTINNTLQLTLPSGKPNSFRTATYYDGHRLLPWGQIVITKNSPTSEVTPGKINSESKKTLNVSRYCKIHMSSFLLLRSFSSEFVHC